MQVLALTNLERGHDRGRGEVERRENVGELHGIAEGGHAAQGHGTMAGRQHQGRVEPCGGCMYEVGRFDEDVPQGASCRGRRRRVRQGWNRRH